ncbi:MAG: NERD domain-containing protein [Patescibacteria group bacterium]|nr:NERD domain-containing protein [bacterium]MDZ4241158.1 NERD domain-containing protein [Patescibacteria group bacterium]
MNSPLKNQILRLPGQSLDEKLQDSLYEKLFFPALLILFSVCFIIFEWIRFYFPFPIEPHPVRTLIAGLIVIIFLSFRLKKNISEIQKIKLGRDGEREVGQSLEELRVSGCVVFHDVLGENFNIDHVVVSPHGIFTIETKARSKKGGNESITFDGEGVIVGSRYPDKHPITQSIDEAIWLKKILKESTGKEFQVRPVIVFPGWFVDSTSSKYAQEKKGLWLLNPKALPTFIKNSSVILNDEDLHLVTFHLSRYIRTMPLN